MAAGVFFSGVVRQTTPPPVGQRNAHSLAVGRSSGPALTQSRLRSGRCMDWGGGTHAPLMDGPPLVVTNGKQVHTEDTKQPVKAWYLAKRGLLCGLHP